MLGLLDIIIIIIGSIGILSLLIASFGSFFKALNDPNVTKEDMAFFRLVGFFYMFKYKITRIFAIIGILCLIIIAIYFNAIKDKF